MTTDGSTLRAPLAVGRTAEVFAWGDGRVLKLLRPGFADSLGEEEAIAAGHGRILGPAAIAGPYAVFAPDGTFIGVYADEGTKARPQVILAPRA